MYLKTLTLHGFKSFPSSIKLEFNKGITSVVGPNGSGKSNVSDAIRWVLGEQSAKNLRGGKMEDVIFFGTKNRKSVSFCEVSMTLCNDDRLIPLDFDEITITRRQTRNGDSVYKINDVTSRLKDVLELFMDTGIGKEGYSIIGQGKIEEILKSKSDERRLLFEEATGIVKYKSRKKEAVNKLEKEKENLVRVNDILKELEIQVGPLKSDAEKAKKYLNLYERKKALHIGLFLLEVHEKENIISELIKKIDEKTILIKNKTNEYNIKENTIITLKDDITDINEKLKLLRTSLSSGKESFLNTSNKVEVLKQKISSILDKIETLNIQISKNELEINETNENIKDINKNVTILDKEIFNLNDQLLLHKGKLDDLNKHLGLNDDKARELNNKIIENEKNITNYLGKISFEEQEYEKLNDEIDSLINEKNNVHENFVNLDLLTATSKENMENKLAETNKLKDTLRTLENKSKIEKEKLYDLSIKKNDINSKYLEKNAKFKALDNSLKSGQGYFDSVKFILNRVKENDERFKGVLGTVSDIFETDEKYEIALSTALSSQVQNIVTDNEVTAKNIINILRDENKGRVTILPLNKVRQNFDNNLDFLNHKGVIGFLSSLVKYDDMFEPICNSLLSKTLVIDTLENAISFNNKFKNKIKIVTLKGDILSTTGSMSGGSIKNNNVSFFSNKRILKTTKEELTSLEELLKNITASYDETNKSVLQYKEDLSYNRDSFSKAQSELQEFKNEFETNSVKLGFTNENLSKLNKTINDLLKLSEHKNKEVKSFYESLDFYEKEKISLNDKLLSHSKTLNEHNDKKEEYQNLVMEFNVLISRKNEEKRSLLENIDRLKKVILNLEKDILKIREETEKENVSRLDILKEIKNFDDLCIKLDLENQNLDKDIIKFESISCQKDENAKFLEISNKELFKEISEYEKSLSTDQIYLKTEEDNINRLYNDMWNEYELTLEKAKEYPKIDLPYSQMKSEFNTALQNMKVLGNVNISSIEKYEEVSERYEFLTTQRQDMIDAEKKLNFIIKDLTTLMEEQFLSKFEIINQNFKEVFIEMFSGGTAELILTDKDDILNSPIEILAEPPGKKLKSLSLMSGGEKSLTAICLLFGILKMKPSPFCVLDEIEAALDDANVDRYAKFLKEFSKTTQFIIITHRKGTMVIADTLYGVTMEEMGVSKLVSVKLTDY